jgi:hypothetical protein
VQFSSGRRGRVISVETAEAGAAEPVAAEPVAAEPE